MTYEEFDELRRKWAVKCFNRFMRETALRGVFDGYAKYIIEAGDAGYFPTSPAKAFINFFGETYVSRAKGAV